MYVPAVLPRVFYSPNAFYCQLAFSVFSRPLSAILWLLGFSFAYFRRASPLSFFVFSLAVPEAPQLRWFISCSRGACMYLHRRYIIGLASPLLTRPISPVPEA